MVDTDKDLLNVLAKVICAVTGEQLASIKVEMHPTFNLECNKVRQDISVKQENIPDKKDIRYNATNQKITYNTKAKRRASTGQFLLPFFTNSV